MTSMQELKSTRMIVVDMMLMLIFLGIFADQVNMMMITLPIFRPVVQALDIDQVKSGVMFLICMQLGLLLPPHGLLQMTMPGVAPSAVTMAHIFIAVVPYVMVSLVLLAAVFWILSNSHLTARVDRFAADVPSAAQAPVAPAR